MVLSKVLSKYQITLPKEAVKALHIQKGSYLRCDVQKGRISFVPVIVEEAFSEEELKKFEKLARDPKNRGSRFSSREEALKHLDSLR